MAKTNEQFDRVFQEKLEGHQEKPSALAWERLESQLPKNSKSGWGVWWAIAASVSALLMVAYVYWPTSGEMADENLVAQTEEILDSAKEQTESGETESLESPIGDSAEIVQEAPANSQVLDQKPSNQKPAKQPESKSKPNSPKQETKIQSLIAEAQPIHEKVESQVTEVPEVKISEPALALPELKIPDLTKTVAAVEEKDDQPLYRVNIYSNGIKKGEPTDKNLITELGKTVGQVEGFLGKVDNGFAEIQDKKDNLFASLTAKKERADQ